MGWKVVDEFSDPKVSGTKGRELRTGWDAMLNKIDSLGSSYANAVLVWDVDRWSRDWSDGMGEAVRVDKLGVQLADTDYGIYDQSTLEGRVMLAVRISGSADFISKIVRNCRRGKNERHMDGYWAGAPPFGYRCLKRHKGSPSVLEQIPEEAEALKWAAGEYIDGARPEDIARAIDARGVPTKRGGQWCGATVVRALTKPSAAGYVVRAGMPTVKGKWDAILTDDEWRACCARREARKKGPNTSPTSSYPLSGAVFCSCGELSWIYHTLRQGKTESKVYRCSKKCGARGVRVHELEQAVLAWWLSKLDLGSGFVEKIAREEHARHAASLVKVRPLLEQMEEIGRREARLIALVEGGGEMESVLSRINELRAQRERLEGEIPRDSRPIALDEFMEVARRVMGSVREVRHLQGKVRIVTKTPHLVSVEGFGIIEDVVV